jgi:methylated-DNA-protein-cysteine methyltransferase-like protein
VCLKHLPSFDPADPEKFFFHDHNVPWQRVVNAKGGISPRGDDGAAVNRQADKLRAEGVEVNDARGIEEMSVDLGRFGWWPTTLPGEHSDESEQEDEDDRD